MNLKKMMLWHVFKDILVPYHAKYIFLRDKLNEKKSGVIKTHPWNRANKP